MTGGIYSVLLTCVPLLTCLTSASLAPPCSQRPSSCASSPSLAQLVLTPVLFLRSSLGFVLASVPCLLHVMRSRSPVAPSLCASFVISPPLAFCCQILSPAYCSQFLDFSSLCWPFVFTLPASVSCC